MRIEVIRKHFQENCTLGEMLVDGEHFAWTLEDKYRNLLGRCELKVAGKTCIDNGVYDVKMSYSPKHGKNVPHLQNVPCFSEIEIHAGNTEIDTLGCILIGSNTDSQSKVFNCKNVVSELYRRISEAKICEIFISMV